MTLFYTSLTMKKLFFGMFTSHLNFFCEMSVSVVFPMGISLTVCSSLFRILGLRPLCKLRVCPTHHACFILCVKSSSEQQLFL